MMETKAKDVTSNNKLKQTHLEQFFNPTNNSQQDLGTLTEGGEKSKWKIGTYNLNNKYKLNKTEIENTILKDMDLDIIGLQETGIKKEEMDNFHLKIKDKNFGTVFVHCKGSIIANESESTVGIIWKKTIGPILNINKYPKTRAIALKFSEVTVLNIYITS
jgi:exonuclease III